MRHVKEMDIVGADFDEDLEDQLRSPENAAYYIMAAIEENDADYLKVALGRVAKVHGISNISKLTDLPRQTLYRMLAPEGNPSLDNFQQILDACGLAFAVVPKERLKEFSTHDVPVGTHTNPGSPSQNPLTEIVGTTLVPRQQVVSRIWNYIKKNGLAEEIMSAGAKDFEKLGGRMKLIAKKIHHTKSQVSTATRRKVR